MTVQNFVRELRARLIGDVRLDTDAATDSLRITLIFADKVTSVLRSYASIEDADFDLVGATANALTGS